ncbi:hypothetical protein ACN4EG_21125 [Alkalinema pantanalense CENA528]|uniref:hypothetical protein n=1 Tax=Alkalinema pantanalense TaxID=1620705 RepID=UPI003D6FF4E9
MLGLSLGMQTAIAQEETETEAEETSAPPDQTDANPLNPAGDSLDKLIQTRFNEDLWKAMLGDLPCLEISDGCVAQLQARAIENSRELKAIDERIEVISQKIAEAKKNNEATVRLGVFEPLVQSWLKLEDVPNSGTPPRKRGLLDRVLGVFSQPLGSINEILSLVGVPLFRNASGGDPAVQQRSIAIADLQVKLAEIENKRGDLAAKIRETVVLQVLEFDQLRREFQISQEISKREVTRMKLIGLSYQLGEGDTNSYLGQLSALDRQKAESFRQWAKLRTQLARVKLLVLGAGEE